MILTKSNRKCKERLPQGCGKTATAYRALGPLLGCVSAGLSMERWVLQGSPWVHARGGKLCGGTGVPTALTFANLHNTHDDDQGQGQELPSCEDVLNPGGPSDAGAVDPREHH